MAVNGVEIQVGQTWRTRDGSVATIEKNDGDAVYPWVGNVEDYDVHGLVYDHLNPDPKDLVELIGGPGFVAPDEVIELTSPYGRDVVPGYESLDDVLQRAYEQAAIGKGKERHANGKAFDVQPMQDLIRLHGVGFATGQASKKASEALGLPTTERQVAELLGAIVYLAGAVIAIEKKGGA